MLSCVAGRGAPLPMPAVVVEDITVLPRIAEPDPTLARQRPVRGVTSAPRGFEGDGFPVRRAFAGVDLADLDPFIHLDQMGEVDYAPGEPKGTRGTRTGASRRGPTSSTGSSNTTTRTAVAARSPTATRSG